MAQDDKGTRKAQVFISYSHEDDMCWFESGSLIPYLKRSLRKDAEFWHDHALEAGDVFRREIEEAIDAADLVILLISQGFVSSEFIEEVELPRIIDRAGRGELEVLPILTHPCLWEDIEFVAERQMVPGKPTPLIEYTRDAGEWSHAKYETLTAVKNRIDKIRGRRKHKETLKARIATRRPIWPKPTWQAADRARLSFSHDGMTHNYCILAGRAIKFGRTAGRVDVRLYEVERCMANLRRQAKEGVPPDEQNSESRVAREQWLLEPLHDAVRVTQLSRGNLGATSDGKKLQQDESCLLGRNQAITISDIIGLKYSANAPAFEALDDVRDLASHILDASLAETETLGLWDGAFGGYRIDRLFSLTGKSAEDFTESKGLESYVLAPGWFTIGSSRDSCVVIPDQKVAPLHAGMIYVNGFFFIVSLVDDGETHVEGQNLSWGIPRPLPPGTEIIIGETTLTFERYNQLFV
jgi:TIR domain-containing protein/FHA domain-containing protein